MFKLGVLGGTFNPIHVGHLIVAQYVLEEAQLDKIIFIPAGNPPHKDAKKIENGTHRYNMIKEAIKFNERFDVSDIELKRFGTTYTYDTLNELTCLYKDAEINFIVGYDTLLDMKNWHKPYEVMKLANFIVVNRNASNTDIYNYTKRFSLKYGGNIKVINIPNIGISSSEIRDRIEKDKYVMYMVTKPVDDYITSNKLYRGDF